MGSVEFYITKILIKDKTLTVTFKQSVEFELGNFEKPFTGDKIYELISNYDMSRIHHVDLFTHEMDLSNDPGLVEEFTSAHQKHFLISGESQKIYDSALWRLLCASDSRSRDLRRGVMDMNVVRVSGDKFVFKDKETNAEVEYKSHEVFNGLLSGDFMVFETFHKLPNTNLEVFNTLAGRGNITADGLEKFVCGPAPKIDEYEIAFDDKAYVCTLVEFDLPKKEEFDEIMRYFLEKGIIDKMVRNDVLVSVKCNVLLSEDVFTECGISLVAPNAFKFVYKSGDGFDEVLYRVEELFSAMRNDTFHINKLTPQPGNKFYVIHNYWIMIIISIDKFY